MIVVIIMVLVYSKCFSLKLGFCVIVIVYILFWHKLNGTSLLLYAHSFFLKLHKLVTDYDVPEIV